MTQKIGNLIVSNFCRNKKEVKAILFYYCYSLSYIYWLFYSGSIGNHCHNNSKDISLLMQGSQKAFFNPVVGTSYKILSVLDAKKALTVGGSFQLRLEDFK